MVNYIIRVAFGGFSLGLVMVCSKTKENRKNLRNLTIGIKPRTLCNLVRHFDNLRHLNDISVYDSIKLNDSSRFAVSKSQRPNWLKESR